MTKAEHTLIAKALHDAALSVAVHDNPEREANQFGGVRVAFDYIAAMLKKHANPRLDIGKFTKDVFTEVNRTDI